MLILINMIDQNLFEGNMCCVEAVRVVQRYSGSPSCGFLAYKLDRTSDRVLQHITIYNKFQTLENTKTQILTYNQVDTQIQWQTKTNIWTNSSFFQLPTYPWPGLDLLYLVLFPKTSIFMRCTEMLIMPVSFNRVNPMLLGTCKFTSSCLIQLPRGGSTVIPEHP